MSNMREISVEECNAVFGGEADEIVVTGLKLVKDDGGGWSGWGWGFSGISFGGYGGGYGGGGSVGSGELPLPEGWDTGPFLGSLVDTDGDGTLDSVEIVVNALEPTAPINYFDIGWGYWGLVGGVSPAENGDLGLFLGVGLPGIQIGAGTETIGELPTGWDTNSPPSVVYRSGAIPIAGYDNVYYDQDNGQSYISGQVYDSYANEYVSPDELQFRIEERSGYYSMVPSG